MERTFVTKKEDVQRDWYVVDAAGQTLGRLATRVAYVLRGKHKPIFSPSVDVGDFVVIVNAEKIHVTVRNQLQKHPTRVIEHAVKGMLPKNRLGRQMFKKLKVYAGPDHPHTAQQPKPLELE